MGVFNVISRTSMAAGVPEDITQVLANFDAIAAILNGGIDNSNINAAAAIAKSKLAALGIVDADISAVAAIAISKLAGYPTDGTKALFGDASWKVPVSGPVVLFDSTLAAPAVSFDTGAGGFATTYAKLTVELWARGDTVAAEIASAIQFNGDTGANYDWSSGTFLASSTAVAPNGAANANVIGMGNSGIPAASAPAGSFGATVFQIPNYGSLVGHKTVTGHGFEKRGTTGPDFLNHIYGGIWRSNAAINRIVVLASSGNFIIGSRMRVIGHP